MAADTSRCPEHGEQIVTRYGSTPGPDPYTVEHLACGHAVIALSGDECDIVIVGTR